MIRRTASYLVPVAAILLVLWSGATISGPRYDTGAKEYPWLATAVDEVRDGFGRSRQSQLLDLGRLNGGRWTKACISGGYTDPVRLMIEQGGEVAHADRSRLGVPFFGTRTTAVEEFELVVAYVDEANKAHFIHLQRGIGAGGQHRQQCIAAPQRRMELTNEE